MSEGSAILNGDRRPHTFFDAARPNKSSTNVAETIDLTEPPATFWQNTRDARHVSG
jgi:hypothetical protein